MNYKEKIEILDNLECRLYDNDITEKDFGILDSMSYDKDNYIRSIVAQILVDLEDKRGEDILIRLARDSDSLVRVEACDSLCISESITTYNFLKDIVMKDRNGMVRGYAVMSLGDISLKINKNNDLTVFLENILVNEKVIFTRINIYTVLYNIGNEEYLTELLSMINTRRYQNRCSVVNCLGDIINDSNKELIVKTLLQKKKNEKSIAVISTIDNMLNELVE